MDDHPTRRLNQPAAARPERRTRRLGAAPPRRVRRPPPPTPEIAAPASYAEPDEKRPALNPAGPQKRPRTYPCPKCGGCEVAVRVRTQGGFYLQRYFGFLNWRNSNLGTWTCTTCGYTEFYATNPANLRDA